MEIFKKDNNLKAYIKKRKTLGEFFDSEKKQILPLLKERNISLLDIGCASGGFYEAIRQFHIRRYLGIDVDCKSIEYALNKVGREEKNAEFIARDFLEFNSDERFDIVNMFEILFLFKNYKEYLKKMFFYSKCFIHFTNRVKTYGKTVLDIKKSHVFKHYLGTEKLLYIIFNLNDLIDYLKKEYNFKLLSVYGYRISGNKGKYYTLPVPMRDVYAVSFLIDVRGREKKVCIKLLD